MAELDDALAALADWLDQQTIRYMVIGGFAVSIWGEPRFTRHLDVTISVPSETFDSTVQRICSQFRSLSAEPLRFARETRVLPVVSGNVPVDIIFAALPYEDEAIARARQIKVGSALVRICSPEDLVIHKIVSPRPRDREDIEGIFRYRHSELDFSYLDPRIKELADALADRNMFDWYQGLKQRWTPESGLAN